MPLTLDRIFSVSLSLSLYPFYVFFFPRTQDTHNTTHPSIHPYVRTYIHVYTSSLRFLKESRNILTKAWRVEVGNGCWASVPGRNLWPFRRDIMMNYAAWDDRDRKYCFIGGNDTSTFSDEGLPSNPFVRTVSPCRGAEVGKIKELPYE